MIRVMVGYWIVCITVISFIFCIAEDDIKRETAYSGSHWDISGHAIIWPVVDRRVR